MEKRRIRLDLAVSLDGFIEGPNGEIDWCIMDPEMNFNDFLNQIDTVFFGRKSYDSWKNYATEDDEEMAEIIASKKKYVFSRSQKGENDAATYINGDLQAEVMKIKKQPGKDIWLFGGADLITSFIDLSLIDEFRLSIHPVVLGAGKPLFMNLEERLYLKLVASKIYSSGVVQLIYHHPDKKSV